MTRRLSLAFVALGLALVACSGSSSPSPTASAASAASRPASAAASAAPAVVAAPCKTKRDLKFEPIVNLTGAWLGDDDGIYYLRQQGTIPWWNGMSGQAGSPAELGRDWNNVANGEIKGDLTIDLNWADVPRGQILGGGTMKWKLVDDGTGMAKLVKVSETGSGFGGEQFTPCAPG